MKYWVALVTLSLLFLSSCKTDESKTETKAIARVDDAYLYLEDINDLVAKGTPKADSLAIVKDFINRWATQKLLFEKAEYNLSTEKQKEFEKLIEQYKIDLYTKAYLEELVMQSIDTVISDTDLVQFYQKNKGYLKANDNLVRMRFINLARGNSKLASISAHFNAGKKEILQSQSISFKNYAFNDSLWIDMPQVYDKLPFVNQDNKHNYIVSGKYFQYSDSLDVYLVKIINVIPKGGVIPYQYIKPTLKKIILNERKNTLLKKIKTEIANDALKNKSYEIYK